MTPLNGSTEVLGVGTPPPKNLDNKIWVCSDLHFGHGKLIEPLAVRPPDYEQRIIRNFLSIDWKPNDTLLNLGDFALYHEGQERGRAFNKLLADLGVHRLLIKGNHDPKSVGKCQRLGFDMALDSARLFHNGKDCWFTHEPIAMLGDGLNIHGHLHELDGHRGKVDPDGRHILISAELMDYRPITLDTLLKLKCTPIWKDGRFERAL